MTQRDRDRLIALKKVKKGVITQRQAAEEIGQTERHVRRLLRQLKAKGDKAIVHALRGRRSNRKLEEKVERSALEILSREVYAGFGPTLAAEYLAEKHGIPAGRETVRKWMIRGKLWRAQSQRVEKIHQWRQRRSRVGELVQWDTSEHAWLEDRGPKLYLISMIDDASSRVHARFVLHDSTEENMRLLWSYVERYGRPVSYYTDKASLFQTAPKVARDDKELPRPHQLLPTNQKVACSSHAGRTRSACCFFCLRVPTARAVYLLNFLDPWMLTNILVTDPTTGQPIAGATVSGSSGTIYPANASSIPEPSSLALLFAGLIAFNVIWRNQNARRNSQRFKQVLLVLLRCLRAL
jgi:transposase